MASQRPHKNVLAPRILLVDILSSQVAAHGLPFENLAYRFNMEILVLALSLESLAVKYGFNLAALVQSHLIVSNLCAQVTALQGQV